MSSAFVTLFCLKTYAPSNVRSFWQASITSRRRFSTFFCRCRELLRNVASGKTARIACFSAFSSSVPKMGGDGVPRSLADRSSSSSCVCAGQRFMPHYHRLGRSSCGMKKSRCCRSERLGRGRSDGPLCLNCGNHQSNAAFIYKNVNNPMVEIFTNQSSYLGVLIRHYLGNGCLTQRDNVICQLGWG